MRDKIGKAEDFEKNVYGNQRFRQKIGKPRISKEKIWKTKENYMFAKGADTH